MSKPYDRAYRKERARILDGDPLCWKGCGRTATTADHVPALALHTHVRGTDCCVLLPCCAKHNASSGGRIGGRRLAGKRRARREAIARADLPW